MERLGADALTESARARAREAGRELSEAPSSAWVSDKHA